MRSVTYWMKRLFLLVALVAVTSPMSVYAADKGHADASPAGPLNISYGEAIWNLLIFLIVLGILAKFVLPVIRDGLKAREEKLEGDLTAAEKAKTDAQASLAQYKQQLTEAQKEAQKVIDEARKSAEQVASRLKAETEQEIVKMKERAQVEITSAKEQALGEVYAQTAELSTQIASRILKREINASDQQQLVSDSLAELTKSGA